VYDLTTRFFPQFLTLQMEWLKIAPIRFAFRASLGTSARDVGDLSHNYYNTHLHNTILSHNSTLFHIIFIIPWYVDLFHFNFNVNYLVVLVLKSPLGEC